MSCTDQVHCVPAAKKRVKIINLEMFAVQKNSNSSFEYLASRRDRRREKSQCFGSSILTVPHGYLTIRKVEVKTWNGKRRQEDKSKVTDVKESRTRHVESSYFLPQTFLSPSSTTVLLPTTARGAWSKYLFLKVPIITKLFSTWCRLEEKLWNEIFSLVNWLQIWRFYVNQINLRCYQV